ncbi:hypothetical protein AAHA92_24798 [Salvia divinorum]|uniref:Uncharacterized protein n=1 Tax=Salvia divinorum TaxID=28513 RepID=A0ABD1GB51_SALDI
MCLYRVLHLVAVEINGCLRLARFLMWMLGSCRNGANLSLPLCEREDAARDFDEEDEVFVSAVMSRYRESKCKRKSVVGSDTSRWALSPQHFLLVRKGSRESGGSGEEEGEFSSAAAQLSRCSSDASYGTFFSVKTHFSRSSSLNKIDSCKYFTRRCIIIQELMQYEGWPFGLCKKAFLLPPLPKSPSDSWSWRKNAGIATSVGSGW